jgi:hypothetical protein
MYFGGFVPDRVWREGFRVCVSVCECVEEQNLCKARTVGSERICADKCVPRPVQSVVSLFLSRERLVRVSFRALFPAVFVIVYFVVY